MQGQFRSFTAKGNGLANVLATPCHVGAWHAVTDAPGRQDEFHAIWDTGATNSVITKRLAIALGLQPFSMVQTHGVHGPGVANVYLVSIRLMNNVNFNQVRVTEGDLKDFDVLIGMDIIAAGDFAVSNAGGVTWFSYRFPSRAHTCYVTEDKHARFPRKGSGKHHVRR